MSADHSDLMANIMVLFGSGGHSTEMLMLLRNSRLTEKLKSDQIHRLTCVLSEDDHLIEDKIKQEFANCEGAHKLETVRLRRARKVGQSYISSVWTTITGFFSSMSLILSHRPHLCLTNGPAISVIVSVAIRCLQLITYKSEIIYVESFCRTNSLSLSGKIIYHLRLANQFLVQWPTLASKYPASIYKGILV